MLGRPVREGSGGYWCAGRLDHAACHVFAAEPVTGKAPAAVAFDRQVYQARFEFGVLQAYLTGSKWRVAAVVDAAGRPGYSLYLSQKKQGRLLLGVAESNASGDTQRFRSACCRTTVKLDAAAGKFQISGAGGGCSIKKLGLKPPRSAAPRLSWTLNGHRVQTYEEQALRFVADRVVPGLKAYLGSRSKAVDGAAVVAWWSLKEGVLGTSNPIAFSLCDSPREVLTDKPAGVCKKRAWQVGMGAVQAPRPPGSPSNWFTKPIATYVASYEAQAVKCYPGQNPGQLLRATSREAGYPAGGSTEKLIVGSTDFVRAAWLLRIPAVGFAQQIARVTSECITNDKSWCHGTKWTSTKKYAPSKSTAATVRATIKAHLDALASL